MQKTSMIVFPMAAALMTVSVLGISSWMSPGTIVPLQQATATSLPTAVPPMGEHSWIIIDLPPDATQLEYGAEVYRLVCKACHGDKGQGLTPDWRAQWPAEDQNCWRSKCHALNHPPDGFYMPQVPAVVGAPVMAFGNALNLYGFIHNYMPWHNPGSMTEKESWSVTAYILKINGIDPGPMLDADTAAQIILRSRDVSSGGVAAVSPTQAASPAPLDAHTGDGAESAASSGAGYLLLGLALLVLLLFLFRWQRKAAHQ